jgi:hypothetical protein
MKKLLCLALALTVALPFAFSQGKTITVRAFVPVDMAGTVTSTDPDTDASSDYDAKMGFGIGAEAMVKVWKDLQVGGGFQYGLGRGIDESGIPDEAKFNFIPIYGLAAYGVNLGLVNPYAIARVGYNLLQGTDEFKGDADLHGGMFFDVGLGASLKFAGIPFMKPFFELDYAINGGGSKLGDAKTDYAYKRVQIIVGAAFSL